MAKWTKEQKRIAAVKSRVLFFMSMTGRGGQKPGSIEFAGPLRPREHRLVTEFLHKFFELRALPDEDCQ